MVAHRTSPEWIPPNTFLPISRLVTIYVCIQAKRAQYIRREREKERHQLDNTYQSKVRLAHIYTKGGKCSRAHTRRVAAFLEFPYFLGLRAAFFARWLQQTGVFQGLGSSCVKSRDLHRWQLNLCKSFDLTQEKQRPKKHTSLLEPPGEKCRQKLQKIRTLRSDIFCSEVGVVYAG